MTTQHVIAVRLSMPDRQAHTFSLLTFFFAGMAPFSPGFFCGFFAGAGALAAGVGVLPFACEPCNQCHQHFSMRAPIQDIITHMTSASEALMAVLAHSKAASV